MRLLGSISGAGAKADSNAQRGWINRLFPALLIVFAAAGGVVLMLMVSDTSEGRSLANEAVRRFHKQADAGEFNEIYAEADDGFRRRTSPDELGRMLGAVRQRLGRVRSQTLTNISVFHARPTVYITTIYAVSFERGVATEGFTWSKRNGQLLLYGFNIRLVGDAK